MDSGGEGRELPSAGELDDETIARKRARRVSFAETTNIHFFDRDEDYETPPDQTTPTSSSKRTLLGFQGDHSDSDDSKGSSAREDDDEEEEGEEEEEEEEEEERFIRDMDSSSPGSVAGSVTSNDDDMFFGPVSTSFIQSGRLSEAGMSDDNNNDITLDSTAFSLHFRNIAAVDDHSANSLGSIRTPTGDLIASNSTVKSKKPFIDSRCYTNTSESGAFTGNMSAVLDNPNKYDYGRLSPTLEKLLNEVDESMKPISPNNGLVDLHSSEIAKSKTPQELITKPSNGGVADHTNINNCLDTDLLAGSLSATTSKSLNSIPSSIVAASQPVDIPIIEEDQEMVWINDKSIQGDQRETIQSEIAVSAVQNLDIHSPPYRRSDTNKLSLCYQVDDVLRKDQQSGNKQYSGVTQLPSTSPSVEVAKHNQNEVLELENKMHTPKSTGQYLKLSSEGSVSSLRAKRKQLILNPSVNSPSKLMNSFDRGNPSFSLDMELKRHTERLSAIKNHITRTKIIETPVDNSYKFVTSLVDLPSVNLESTLDKITITPIGNPIHVPLSNLASSIVTPAQQDKSELIVQAENFALVSTDNIVKLGNDEKSVDEITKFCETMSSSDAHMSEIGLFKSPIACQNVTEEPSNSSRHSSFQGAIELKVSSELSNSSREANHHNTTPYQELLNVQGNLAGNKRTVRDFTAENNSVSKLSRREISPKFSGDLVTGTSMISQNDLYQSSDSSREVHNTSPVKLGTDILSKVLETAASVFSPSISKLNLQQLDVLEDILGELQTSRKYVRFCSSLKNSENLTDLKVQRLTEARLVKDKLLFEQARLQLKRVKLEILHNKAHQFQSGFRECHNLKAIFSNLYLQCVNDIQNKNIPCQEDNDLILSKKSELELLKQKVNTVTKSLEVSCMIKEESTCDEIVKVASRRLEMKNLYRKVHEHLRLWKLSDIVKSKDKNDIVLNYCNFLYQRFVISAGQVSNITVRTSFDGETIEKRFPNMNSCVAFEFVFKGSMKSGLPSLSCFGQKIQETTLLMGLVVDVLEEVQVALLKLLSLTYSSFSLEISGGLELHLCFTNFKSGQKLTLILDMTMLNCAMYPSEPSELKYKILGARTTLPQSVLDRIEASVESLQGGQRPVILRFCQSIAGLVNDCP